MKLPEYVRLIKAPTNTATMSDVFRKNAAFFLTTGIKRSKPVKYIVVQVYGSKVVLKRAGEKA